MKATCVLLALLFLAVSLHVSAAPVTANGSIRTIVYRYSVDEHGFTGAPSMHGYGIVTENGSADLGGSTGTIRVDVVKATDDGGLVVDVTQAVDRELRPLQTIRCALYGRTQDVVCDQNLVTTEAESVLLMFLGRYFYEPSRAGENGEWQTSPHFHDSQMAIVNDYRVTKTDGDVLTLKVHRLEKGGGYLATTDGTIVYNSALEVPDFIKLTTGLQRSGDQGDMNVRLDLVSDSMAPAGGQNSH